jgi:type I restriction-modification system DNA methylase subunit
LTRAGGPVDAADFKTYVFPLLFFKRISDVYDEEYAAAIQRLPNCAEVFAR